MNTQKKSIEPMPAVEQTPEELQSEAWGAFNAAFHAPDAEGYRQAGHDLYRRILEVKIQALFLRGDEQNRIIEARFHA